MARQSPVGQDLFIVEISRSHSDTLPSVRLLWTSDQPDAENLLDNKRDSQETTRPPAGFEPAISASERPQTHNLDSSTTASTQLYYILIL
jgi:hypothetical protein